jgi:hypothetical protein
MTSEWHFHHSVQLLWQKLDEYYTLADDSPAYVASISGSGLKESGHIDLIGFTGEEFFLMAN